MTRMKKKFEAGASTNYISRRMAIRKLQLSLKDFRRLCILKGIYPHEPKHKKKVNKGSTENKTWYYVKDIHFLAHEPIINKFRQYKVFLRRLTKAKNKKETETVSRLHNNKPVFNIDNIVKERYPNIVDAIRDLDDALCLLFLFARLPQSGKVKPHVVHLCRRLAVEFMHYVIAAKALRKAFVSIKGIYYQAEIMGEKVTWIVPHERGQSPYTDVDFSIMATFVEFYTTMMGFINFGLYQSIGLHYPPKLDSPTSTEEDDNDLDAPKERVYSLAQDLLKAGGQAKIEEDAELDVFPVESETSDEVERAKQEQERVKRLQRLFEKKRFFLSRETPRESLTLLIRSCGGEASWESTVAYGATFTEDDSRIDYQISDRPSITNKHLSRYYVQPQWVYDCVNAGRILPVEKYFCGMLLPPHLSPFVQPKLGDYVPPEQLELMEKDGEDVSVWKQNEEKETQQHPPKKKPSEPVPGEKGMEVVRGKTFTVHPQTRANAKGEEKKLQESMISKKHKRVYQKITKGQKRQSAEVRKLKEKRKRIEEKNE